MKKQILLTLWIVLLVNGIMLWFVYYFNNNVNFVRNNLNNTGSSVLLTTNNVVKQNKNITYNITDIQSKVIDTLKKVWNSVVSIVISKNLNVYYYSDPFSLKPYVERKKEKIWWWSGIIVSKAGYILTNKHVVADLDADYSVVTKNWDVYKVDKIWTDPILDLAIVHVVKKNWTKVYDLPAANIIDFHSKVNVWQFVLAIGDPFAEYDNTVTLWILSAKWRKLKENNGSLYIWLYQTDAAINPWNSWWPLINIDWEVIWVNTAITAQGQWIGFSIPINQQFVNATLKSIQKYWKIKRPLLWVKIIQLNKTIAKKFKLSTYEWALVQDVLSNSPAFKAGLKKWDIIISVDDVKINENKPIIYTIFTKNIGDTIKVTINRNWNILTKSINLAEF